jgi:hypothetical protein
MKLNLSYKQQFFTFAGIFVICLWIVYGISIKPTVAIKRQVREKEKAVEALSSAPGRINVVSNKLEKINRQFSSFSMSGSTSRDLILEEISSYCSKNGISVYNYPESHIVKQQLFTLETNKIVLKSSFKRLIKLIHFLENKASFGRIISLRFYTEENRKTKQKVLFLELVIQNIKNDEQAY